MSEATIHDLSDPEMADYMRKRRRSRLDNCQDGKCGGCPSCLEAQGYVEEEEDTDA